LETVRQAAQEEGRLEGLLQAREEGSLEGKLECVPQLLEFSLTLEQIAYTFDLEVETARWAAL
jgi:predicted transposase YdaD